MAERLFAKTCSNCRQKAVAVTPVPYTVTIEHDGHRYDVHVPALFVPRCGNCGEYTIDRIADQEIDHAFRTMANLLSVDEIRAGRKKLGMSEAEFAMLLGVGEATVVRWESGALVPQRSHDGLIRGVLDVPEFRAYLGALHGVKPTAA